MHNLSRIGFATAGVFLSLIMLFVSPLLTLASVPTASGHFEVYCDGVGLFLARIDSAPAPGKLVLFSRMGFPPGAIGGRYFGQGKGPDLYVFREGGVPEGRRGR